MELIRSKLVGSHPWRCRAFLSHRVCDSLLVRYCSTSTDASPSPSASKNGEGFSLYQRILNNGDLRVSSILDHWVLEGRVNLRDLRILITRLCNFRRYSDALQVSKWMKKKFPSRFIAGDTAMILELIFRIKGLQEAEKYFSGLPRTSKTPVVFSALLKIYCVTKSLKKAEALMMNMKKIGFANSIVPYNLMLELYLKVEMYEKVEQIIQEMEQRGFFYNGFSYIVQLRAYSDLGKVKEMEALLMKMEVEPTVIMNYSHYITASNGFLKAGIVDKSLIAEES